MQRKPILDIVPRNKPGGAPKARGVASASKLETREAKRPTESTPRKVPRERPARSSDRKPHGSFFRYIFLVLAVLGIGAAAMTYYAKATISIVAKSDTATIAGSLVASASSTANLPYRVMTIEQDATTTVPASSKQTIENKAAGFVVIYNDFTASPYRLIKNTRLEAPNNLIFKIADTVVVPGKKTTPSGTVPGSIVAAVFADSPGKEYNVGLTDFTIPAFKGTPKYTGFYGRSKTPIGGGWSGTKNVASDADTKSALSKLESGLSDDLAKEASSEIPDGFVLLKGAYATEWSIGDGTDAGDAVALPIHAKFRAAIFARKDLAAAVTQKANLKNPMPSEIVGLESLVFQPAGDMNAILSSNGPLAFSLGGTVTFKAIVDEDKLRSALAGTPRSSISAILSGFPAVSKADVSVTPFWKPSFPNDPARISITEE